MPVTTPSKVTTVLTYVTRDLFFLFLFWTYINGNIQYVCLCLGFLKPTLCLWDLSTLSWIAVAVLIVFSIPCYEHTTIYPFYRDGHLSYFSFGTMKNSTILDIFVRLLVCTCRHFCWEAPTRGSSDRYRFATFSHLCVARGLYCTSSPIRGVVGLHNVGAPEGV